eukprot:TRINITY_DN42601_c0_g1_i1.p1 TRINITY_DN42601_c0_g1~~TRINITY_DN42601_c0_g1_i1.p1  ORF type:complete len:274 (+),score=82.03 TRINITY_DN42601_c0_g1_i1:102-923(+)
MTGRASARATVGATSAGTQAATAVAAVASVLFVITLVSLNACKSEHVRLVQRLESSARGAEGFDIDPGVLERQSAVMRNLTARVQTAEAALQRLRDLESTKLQQALAEQRKRLMQKRQVAAAAAASSRAQPRKPAGAKANAASAPAAAAAKGAGAAQEQGEQADDGDDITEADDDEESEEAEASPEDAEEERQLQLKLINYNPANKTFLRWRSDFKCGPGTPDLPDEQVVECNPRSRMPCCSALGWCGITRAHCVCATCIDYRKVRRKAATRK